ncbi:MULTISPECIES: CBS domain-containing protein [Pseudomonas]|uniref:Inosine-5-monophosphate dehydrogenase n=1 Tax=Pseudomonas fluorescens TaxID=294 RepID=A0A166QYG1_PSEFL|nr:MULTISPECIES: CBS domain-containing protein [Pseudomonas]KZN21037.1 inosine-5-monophosphate dehydrogenase [Pseudomonas fluorescens]
MKISEVMTKDVLTAKPSQTIQEAANMMARIDSGAIMVEEQERLIGMITDRDIAIRAVAEGLPGKTPISKVMTGGIRYCFEDEDIENVAKNMADVQLRRLPVLNRDKRLVGVVSLGNIASTRSQSAAVTVLRGVAQAH